MSLSLRQMKRQREGTDPHVRSSMDAAEIQTYGQKWGRCCVSPTFEPGTRSGSFTSMTVAEDRGFEPLRAFTQPAFQASAIGH